eukprot:Platyproteum_vivax@DN9834_c0_g1_i1.p1
MIGCPSWCASSFHFTINICLLVCFVGLSVTTMILNYTYHTYLNQCHGDELISSIPLWCIIPLLWILLSFKHEELEAPSMGQIDLVCVQEQLSIAEPTGDFEDLSLDDPPKSLT